ncbi:MAG: hypothetical protein ACOC1X_00510 [Promethearchaeota archaeon]
MQNKLNDINMDVDSIERKLRKFKLEFIKNKRSDIERKIKFPMFVKSFYNYIDEYANLPTQETFFDYYIQKNKNNKNIKKLNDDQLEGLRARIYRAYPSYIRDLHFAKILQEKTELEEVIYNVELDVNGTDVLVKENGINYAVNLFVDTKRSNMARIRKKKRHNKDKKYIDVELPLVFNKAREVGDFFLYGKRELIEFLNLVLKTQREMG